MRDDLKADKVLAWIGKLLKCLGTEYSTNTYEMLMPSSLTTVRLTQKSMTTQIKIHSCWQWRRAS